MPCCRGFGEKEIRRPSVPPSFRREVGIEVLWPVRRLARHGGGRAQRRAAGPPSLARRGGHSERREPPMVPEGSRGACDGMRQTPNRVAPRRRRSPPVLASGRQFGRLG